MEFEWDAAKEAANREKHGVGFPQAAEIFEAPVIERRDPRDYGEERRIALGRRPDGDILIVVFTWRGQRRRIISAWRAGRHERAIFEGAAGPVPD